MESLEENFNNDLWYVLQKIRKQFLYKTQDKNATYSIVQGFFGRPYNDDEKSMMEKLHEWDAILLEENNGVLSFAEDGKIIFNIKETKPKFVLMYRLFENAIKDKIDPKRLFELRQELVHPLGRDTLLSFELWQLTKKSDEQNKKRTLSSLASLDLSNIQFIYGLSQENRLRIRRLIELIQNKIELGGYNRLNGTIKIPEKLLDKEGYTLSETELLVEAINKVAERTFIEVKNKDYGISSVLSSRVLIPGAYGLYDEETNDKKGEYLNICLINIATLQKIKDHIDAFEKRLAEMNSKSEKNTPIQKIEKPLKISVGNSGQNEIFYNNKTAIGEINGREFRFKPDSPVAEVFSSVWGMINVPLKRQEILVISGFYQEGEKSDPLRRSEETYHINDIAKYIRRVLKVDVKNFINNDGNLTLLGRKLKSPKLNQTAPN